MNDQEDRQDDAALVAHGVGSGGAVGGSVQGGSLTGHQDAAGRTAIPGEDINVPSQGEAPETVSGDDYPLLGGVLAPAKRWHLQSLPVPGGIRAPATVDIRLPADAEVIDFVGGQGTPRVIFMTAEDGDPKPDERTFSFVRLGGEPLSMTAPAHYVDWKGWVRGEPEVLAVEVVLFEDESRPDPGTDIGPGQG